MSYVFAMSGCLVCHDVFCYNPHKVPSHRVNGVREPICNNCMIAINAVRQENGIPPLYIDPDAYDPINENEL